MKKRILRVIPKPGLKVRDPQTKKYLPESGLDLEIDPYWIRREASKEVSFAEIKQENDKKTNKKE